MKTKMMFAVLLIAIMAGGAFAQPDIDREFTASCTISGADSYFATNPDANLHLLLMDDTDLHPLIYERWVVANTSRQGFREIVFTWNWNGGLKYYKFVLFDYNLDPAHQVLFTGHRVHIGVPATGYKFKELGYDYDIRGGKSADDDADAASWGEIKSLYR